MQNQKLIIGSRVSMKSPKYLLGAIEEALSYDANTFMFYIGPSKNKISNLKKEFFVKEFKKKLIEKKLNINNIIIHAPYIINLANTINKKIYKNSVYLLKNEIIKCQKIGIKILVLHPGSAVGASTQDALNQIIKGLNSVFFKNQNVKIALETMSGRGSEVGINFKQFQYIINNVTKPKLIGICWDTCHLYSSGYDLNNNLKEIINEFDKLIGLNKLLVIHINDSKYPINSHKDNHANIGMGYIGFKSLINIIYHPLLISKIKILETPLINGNYPYFYEIKMIKIKKYDKKILNFWSQK